VKLITDQIRVPTTVSWTYFLFQKKNCD